MIVIVFVSVFAISINTVNRHLGFSWFCSTTAILSKHALATPLEVSSFVASTTTSFRLLQSLTNSESLKNHSRTHSLTHSLTNCPGHDNIRNELHCLLSTHDVVFKSLNDEDKIKYSLTLENETTSKIVGKYTYLMFQKRKDILHSKYN